MNQPNEQYASFIQAIIANPRDDECRLVFADFLEEVGDPRAELIRVQFELAELAAFDRRRRKFQNRENRIAKKLGTFTTVPKEAKVLETCGGFVDHIEITITRFLKHHREIFASSPIRKVTLKAKSAKFSTLKDLEGISQLSHLTLRQNDATGPDWIELITSPSLRNLEGLTVYAKGELESVTHAVTQATEMTKLKHLGLHGQMGDDNEFGGYRGVNGKLAEAKHLSNLVSLLLTHQTVESLSAIANSEIFSNVHTLRVSGHYVGEGIGDGVRAIQTGSSLRKLHTLDVTSYSRGIQDQFDVDDPLPELRVLSFGVDYREKTLSDIAARYHDLEELVLSQNQIGDKAIMDLANSPLLNNLERLSLTNNRVTMKGVNALLQSPYWNGKTNLYLLNNRISLEDIKALRKAHGSKFGNFGDLRHLEFVHQIRGM